MPASFRVGDWHVEPGLDQISRGDEAVSLRPQVMELLVYLGQRAGQVVSTEDLLEDLWPDRVVTIGSVYNCVGELRHALANDGDPGSYVETIPKRGYRLTAPVSGLGTTAAPRRQSVRSRRHGPAIWLTAAVLAVTTGLWIAQRNRSADPPGMDRSIAVLPFKDLSPAGDQDYLSDGFSEELLNDLSRLDGLRVISRASSFALEDSGLGGPQLADRLGVAYLLEGSVRKAGDRIRVTAQLIEGRSDAHLWSETYDRTLDDVFAIQKDISSRVADALRIRILGAVPAPSVTDPATFELYLKGRHQLTFRTRESLKDAENLFAHAITTDPEYAQAHAGLAKSLWLQAEFGYTDAPEARRRAIAAVERALQYDADNSDALATKGLMLSGDTSDATRDEARRLLEAAIARNPNNSDAYRWLGLLYSESNPDRYLEYMRKGHLVDPLLSGMNFHLIEALSRGGHFNEALAAARHWHELYPGYGGPFGLASVVQSRAGRLDRALAGYYRAWRTDRNVDLVAYLPWQLVDLGEPELARDWALALQRRDPDDGDAVLLEIVVTALQGQRDRAVGRLAAVDAQHPRWRGTIARAALWVSRDFERARLALEGDPATLDDDAGLSRLGVPWMLDYALALQRTGEPIRSERLIEAALEVVESQRAAGMIHYGDWYRVRPSTAFHAAALHALRGDAPAAVSDLERDAARGYVSCRICLDLWPHFDGIRKTPAFVALEERQADWFERERERLADQGLLLPPARVAEIDALAYDPFAD